MRAYDDKLIMITSCWEVSSLLPQYCPLIYVKRLIFCDLTMEENFKGKRALVTGAGQGIGRKIAEALANLGASVVALDISQTLLDELQSELPSIETLVVDLSDWTSVSEALKSISLDLVVNNAGVAIIGPMTAITEEDYEKIFSVNIKALINITRIAIGGMVARKSQGAIVNISSQASKAALLDHSLYCATKGAVDAFTRAVALEYGPHKIRINCVNPTVVMTELGKKVWGDPEKGKPLLAKIPLQRFAQVGDVVDAVLFLLSDKARMITGSCLPVDGGFLAC